MADVINIKLNCSNDIYPKALYVLNLISTTSGIKIVPSENGSDITYGGDYQGKRLYIPFNAESYKPVDINNCSWQEYHGLDLLLPPLFLKSDSDPSEANLNFDLIGSIYCMLSSALKCHNSLSSDLQGSRRHIQPFIKQYIKYFINRLKTAGLIHNSFTLRSPWVSQAPFALGLSHDIDILNRTVTGSLKLLANSIADFTDSSGVVKSLRGLVDASTSYIKNRPNPYHCFKRWLSEDSNKSTFFIFDGQRSDDRDPVYTPEQLSKTLQALNVELPSVAVHNSINSWKDQNYLADIKLRLSELLGQKIAGIRPHYLNCEFPLFWQNIAGYEYSSSVGSDKLAGFTAGIDLPFFGFDLSTGKRLDILEIPITLMDCCLFESKISDTRAKMIDDLINSCADDHSLLVLDWHNRTAYDPDFPGWFDAYKLILEKARSRGAQIDSLDNINYYWRKYCGSL